MRRVAPSWPLIVFTNMCFNVNMRENGAFRSCEQPDSEGVCRSRMDRTCIFMHPLGPACSTPEPGSGGDRGTLRPASGAILLRRTAPMRRGLRAARACARQSLLVPLPRAGPQRRPRDPTGTVRTSRRARETQWHPGYRQRDHQAATSRHWVQAMGESRSVSAAGRRGPRLDHCRAAARYPARRQVRDGRRWPRARRPLPR